MYVPVCSLVVSKIADLEGEGGVEAVARAIWGADSIWGNLEVRGWCKNWFFSGFFAIVLFPLVLVLCFLFERQKMMRVSRGIAPLLASSLCCKYMSLSMLSLERSAAVVGVAGEVCHAQ